MKKENVQFCFLLVAAAVILTTGCSDFFQGKIPMDNTKNTGTLEDLLTPAREVTELAPRNRCLCQSPCTPEKSP